MHETYQRVIPIECIFRPDVHESTADMLKPLLNAWFVRYLPTWVQEFSIQMTENDCVFEITVNFEYRQIVLGVGPNFLLKTPLEWRFALVHEAVHAHTAVLEDCCLALIKLADREDDVFVIDQYEKARETAVQDMSMLLLSLPLDDQRV